MLSKLNMNEFYLFLRHSQTRCQSLKKRPKKHFQSVLVKKRKENGLVN